MRIAQVAPLYESCPPQLYGGTERVVSYLTEELIRQGHEVTLFASGDSRTAAWLKAPCERALRLNPFCQDPLAHHMILLNRVLARAGRFDIIHFHTDYLHFPVFARQPVPTVTTLHGRLDLPDLPAVFREFSTMPLVSISDDQRRPLAWANWCATIHHGLPSDLYRQGSGTGGYLAFMGRISPEKRADLAIEIARRAGLPLKIAAKVDKVDVDYFGAVIKPLLDDVKPLLGDPPIGFIGEIGDEGKADFLGNAAALLFPVDWPEPFGLVMIEAMANGTPIIAYRNGSVPEVIEENVTGFIVEDIDAAVAAVRRIGLLDRATIRRRFEERFSAERMARDYLAIYAELTAVPELPEVIHLRGPVEEQQVWYATPG